MLQIFGVADVKHLFVIVNAKPNRASNELPTRQF